MQIISLVDNGGLHYKLILGPHGYAIYRLSFFLYLHHPAYKSTDFGGSAHPSKVVPAGFLVVIYIWESKVGRPKIRTVFRIKAFFWPTDLPIPLSIPANYQLIPTNDTLTLEYKWAKEELDMWKKCEFWDALIWSDTLVKPL